MVATQTKSFQPRIPSFMVSENGLPPARRVVQIFSGPTPAISRGWLNFFRSLINYFATISVDYFVLRVYKRIFRFKQFKRNNPGLLLLVWWKKYAIKGM